MSNTDDSTMCDAHKQQLLKPSEPIAARFWRGFLEGFDSASDLLLAVLARSLFTGLLLMLLVRAVYGVWSTQPSPLGYPEAVQISFLLTAILRWVNRD